MFKYSARILLIGSCLAFGTGCATNSDIKNLQAQIDDLKPTKAIAEDAASKAEAAMRAAQAAERKASAAEAAASRAASLAQDTNSKLDRMFEMSMRK